MAALLNNTYVQILLALCTLLGGVVAFIQLGEYINKYAPKPPQRRKKKSTSTKIIPAWIGKQPNIIKKAALIWLYQIFSTILSGDHSSSSFKILLRRTLPAGILLSLFAVSIPAVALKIIIWLFFMAPFLHYSVNSNEFMLEQVLVAFVGGPFGLLLYIIPSWMGTTFFPIIAISSTLWITFDIIFKPKIDSNSM